MDKKESKEDLKKRIQVAKGKIEEYKRRGISDITINVKHENTVKEVKIDVLGTKLDKIDESIDKLSEEEFANFDETELEIKEAIIKELEKTLPRKQIVPCINISIKKKRCCCKLNGVIDYVWLVSLILAVVGVILIVIINENFKNVIYFIASGIGIILGGFFLHFLIEYCIDEDNSRIKRLSLSFLINFLFSILLITFVNTEDFSNNHVKILFMIALILLIIITYRSTHIENRSDFSLLKASNLFIAFFLTAIKHLIETKTILCVEKKILLDLQKFIIEYYFLLPLIGVRGLYDLFDGKRKKIKSEETS